MPDEVPDLTPAEQAAARAEFLSNPPPEITDPPEPAPTSDAAEEAAAIEEALGAKPPAGQEGAAPVAAPAPAPAPTGTPDPYAQFGGLDSVQTAFAVQEALRTENGLRALVANGLLELGYDVNAVRTALDQYEEGAQPAPAAAADPFASFEDDDPVTVAQARALAEQTAQRAVEAALAATQDRLGPVQDAVLAQQNTAVRNITDATVVEVLGPIPADPEELARYQRNVDAIVERGARYFDPQRWADPGHVRAAVIQANAEIQQEQEQRFQDFLARRRQVRDSQPVNIGGGAGSEGPLPEPKNLNEARDQARAAGFFS